MPTRDICFIHAQKTCRYIQLSCDSYFFGLSLTHQDCLEAALHWGARAEGLLTSVLLDSNKGGIVDVP